MKILLTGATGFIGSNFIRLATARGHEIAALVSAGRTLPADLSANKNIVWLHGNLATAPLTQIAEFAPDVCVHTAWITTPGIYLESPDNVLFLNDSIKFLKQVVAIGVRHIVGLGSCVEYQMGDEYLSEEKTPILPTTTYARCKNELRLALEAETARNKFMLSWARVFYPYGPGEHPSRLCSSIIQKLSRNEKILLKTPDSTKDYIHIDDLASGLLAVVENKSSGPINLGTGTGTTVREIAQIIANILNKPHLIEAANPPEFDALPRVVADAAKLKNLGWRPRISLNAGLTELCERLANR